MWVLSTLGAVVVRLLATTWRVRVDGGDTRKAAIGQGRRVVLALWHGELLPLLWYHRSQRIAVLISTHADGEIIARIVESLGLRAVRGSSSHGGARALLGAVRQLEEGWTVGFTTDGPRGPRRVSAPGVGAAAAKGLAVVVALGAHVDRYWQVNSWDRMVIPKPFARVAIRFSPPIAATGTRVQDGHALVPSVDAALHLVCMPDVARER